MKKRTERFVKHSSCCCLVIDSIAARPFHVCPCNSVDISCADRREKKVGKEKRKQVLRILPMPRHRVSILVIDAHCHPPTILWILAALIEDKTEV